MTFATVRKTDGGRREENKTLWKQNENAIATILGPSDVFIYHVLASKTVSFFIMCMPSSLK